MTFCFLILKLELWCLGGCICQYTETLVHLVFCLSQGPSLPVAAVPILCENKMLSFFFFFLGFCRYNLVP